MPSALEIAADADDELVEIIQAQEELRSVIRRARLTLYDEIYRIPGPLDLTGLMDLYTSSPTANISVIVPFTPKMSTGLRRHGEGIFSAISRRDILLHHPYDDFCAGCRLHRPSRSGPSSLGDQTDAVSNQR